MFFVLNMSNNMYIHTPVLLKEVLSYVTPVESRSLFIDATLGEGGYADAFLKAFPQITLIGIDRDASILAIAKQRLASFGKRIRFFHMWFDEFFNRFHDFHHSWPDRIIFDLGISRFHYEASGRGFSFAKDEPLDMRLSEELPLSAYDIINTYSEQELVFLFKQFGEERFSGRIAREIVRERKTSPIKNALILAEIIKRAVPKKAQYNMKIHPATRCFKALRIAVNSELERLKNGLEAAFSILDKGGRLGVVSYHSLEDRIVKRYFKEKNSECRCPPDWPICQCKGVREAIILTRKPVQPGIAEKKENRASRSAKLRVIEKIVPRGAE